MYVCMYVCMYVYIYIHYMVPNVTGDVGKQQHIQTIPVFVEFGHLPLEIAGIPAVEGQRGKL